MTAPQQPTGAYVPEGYKLKKKRHPIRNLFLLALVVIVVVIIAVSVGGGGSSGGGNTSDTVHVSYTIESDSPTVSATYTTLQGGNIGQSQDNNVAPPWTKELDVEDSFAKSFGLIGQMNPVALSGGGGTDGTTITCRITVDGEVVAKQTSTGTAAVVNCNAS